MGYIYIFTNSDHKDLSILGFSDDWHKELSYLNSDPNNLAFFDWDSICHSMTQIEYGKFIASLDNRYPQSKVFKINGDSTSYIKISPRVLRQELELFARKNNKGSILIHPAETYITESHRNISNNTIPNVFRYSKIQIIDYVVSKGYSVNRKNCNVATRNVNNQIYWINPNFRCLDSDWNIILNDTALKKYYLLEIKGGTIKREQLVARSDMPHKIQIKINYGDPNLVDSVSGYPFGRFKVAEIDYSHD